MNSKEESDPHPTVDRLFAFLGEDSAGMEHIMSSEVGGQSTPLISRDVGTLVHYREMAKAAAAKHGLTVRLVSYTERKEIDTFKPTPLVPDTTPNALEKPPETHDTECNLTAGRCDPCAQRLLGAMGKLVDYIKLAKEQQKAGEICPLCARGLVDEVLAHMLQKIGTSGSRTEFVQMVNTLLALFQEKFGVSEFPKTNEVVREVVKGLE